MKYLLIASDLDETLLDDHRQICQRNIDAIKRAKKKGVKFVPATGRGYLSVQRELKILDLYQQEDEYTLSFNGGALTENKENRLLSFEGLSFEKTKDIFEYGLSCRVGIHIYTKDHVYLYHLDEDEALRFSSFMPGSVIMKEDNMDFLHDVPISKILFHCHDVPYLMSLEEPMRALWENACSVSYSSNQFMEFNRIGVDKGVGLKNLAHLLGIDLSQTIAVGDNYNDIAMLKVAGLSVAPQNAVDDVKKICDVVTEADHNEGAIAEIIEKYID